MKSTDFDFLTYGLTNQFGELHFLMDPETGLKAVIAIHSTHLGPALGGCRFIPYESTQAAILDAMRLAQGMSYKAALAQLPLGGGKAVLLKPEGPFDRERYFDKFGQFVESLKGRYVTSLDSGATIADMDRIHLHTDYVAGLSTQGDPSPYTVTGLLYGIEALVAWKLKKHDLAGLHIALDGLGHVGWDLASRLHERGVKLTVADINQDLVQRAQKEFQATVVSPGQIHAVKCDVFSPCALGGIINDKTLPEIQAPIIAGAANNQLAEARHGQALLDRHIAYAVDYVINAGGLLFAAHQYCGQSVSAPLDQQLLHIKDTLIEILEHAQHTKTPPNEVADHLAKQRIQA